MADLNLQGALVRYEFPEPRRRNLLRQALCCLHKRDLRLVSFNDLVIFATFGLMDREEAPASTLQRRLPAIQPREPV